MPISVPMSMRSEAERLALARQGDAGAWSEIVAELGPKLRGYARARGAPDPDDVMQDVLLATAERLGTFDGDERAFRSWVFSIAYRQIVNRHRSAGREKAWLGRVVPDGEAASPEEDLVNRLSGSAALAALTVLTDVERDVVLMRVVGELDTEEVARAVGKQPGNVRVIQSRALKKVRRELERTGYGSEADRRRSRP